MKDRVSIARFISNKNEDYYRILKEEFENLVNKDPYLFWYEDVDEFYRNRQLTRKIPAIKMTFVFNYNPRPVYSEFEGTYISGKIWIKINAISEVGRKKIEEITKAIGGEARYV